MALPLTMVSAVRWENWVRARTRAPASEGEEPTHRRGRGLVIHFISILSIVTLYTHAFIIIVIVNSLFVWFCSMESDVSCV